MDQTLKKKKYKTTSNIDWQVCGHLVKDLPYCESNCKYLWYIMFAFFNNIDIYVLLSPEYKYMFA